MNILFIGGFAGWGSKFSSIAESLSSNDEISDFHIISQGIDSYEDICGKESTNHLSFEELYKEFLDSSSIVNKHNLEQRYGPLYKIAASDRTLLQFTHPIEYGRLHSQDFMTSYVAYWLNFYENFLVKNKIDVVVTSVIASVMSLTAAMVCEKKNIKLLSLGLTRYPDRATFYKDIQMTERIHFSDYTFHHLEKAEKLIEEKNKKQINPSWLEWKKQLSNPLNIFNYVNSIRSNNLYKKYKLYFGLVDFKDPILFLPTISLRIKSYVLKMIRSYYYSRLKKLAKLPKGKFYLYALHVDPEMATSVLALNWIDQLDLIKRIKIQMYHDVKLLVKEHPSMIGIRNVNFYKEIQAIPGVEICSDSLATEDLIKSSALVISITGTISLEAAIFNKPSFLFAKTDFSSISSISVFDGNLDLLGKQLKMSEEICLKDISEIKEFLADNYANSVSLTGSEIWNSETKNQFKYINKMTYLLSKSLNEIKDC